MSNVLPVRRMTKIFTDFYGSADSEKRKFFDDKTRFWQTASDASKSKSILFAMDYETRKCGVKF